MMPDRNPRVDAYLEKAPEYARPILKKLRAAIHAADKQLTEDIKWGSPAFVKKGTVCSIVAFKKHTAVWFHKGSLLDDPDKLLRAGNTAAMRAVHFTDEKEVRAKAVTALVKNAVALDDAGVKAPKKAPRAPKELTAALGKNAKAKEAFSLLAPSHKRNFGNWIATAKRPETKQRRVQETVSMLLRGEKIGDGQRTKKTSKKARAR